MALSADTQPHFTTIAEFISTMDEKIIRLFLEVLMVCDEMGLIGKEMFAAIKFRGRKTDCRACGYRKQCLRTPESTETRQVHFFMGSQNGTESYTEKMKRKIDSIKGRTIYNRRLAIAETPFAHIRSKLRLDRFNLRGKRKVNTEWLLYCIVHNLTKVHRYGEGFA